jgi:hypothetical protein
MRTICVDFSIIAALLLATGCGSSPSTTLSTNTGGAGTMGGSAVQGMGGAAMVGGGGTSGNGGAGGTTSGGGPDASEPGAGGGGVGGTVDAGTGTVDVGASDAQGTGLPGVPTVQDFHLTARPWVPLNLARDRYLRNAESVARAMLQYQNATGAIIDPVKRSEWQYGTAFFIYAGAALVDTGRAPDLLDATVRAMDHTSGQIAAAATMPSASVIPNDHGNFFVAPLAGAYMLLRSKVPAATADRWRTNLATPIERIGVLYDDNWRTYSMKGEWLRGLAGIVPMQTAVGWVEYNWTGMGAGRAAITPQLSHVGPANLQFYHDIEIEPETYAYESVARMNIEAILENGYNGSQVPTMTAFTVQGGENVVKTLDPTGQGAAAGRSSDHSWNDVVPGNVYERLANRWKAQGDNERAGRYRRAAMLVLRGSDRWLRSDGSYSTTKNQFDFALQVHYADYSARTNYNGSMMYHQSESYYEHHDGIDEWPTWNEIGGYALQTDAKFEGGFVNAGGMHVQVALRGQTTLNHTLYWTALGVVRFSRVDWDSRLGPSDGIRDETSNLGLSFAPTFMQNGSWVRLASMPDVYRADMTVSFVHPLLVRFALDYHPLPGQSGPTFHQDFAVTPDGVLTTLTSSAAAGQWGLTWPLLANDGAGPLVTSVAQNLATTRFASGTDEQNFIAVGGASTLTMDGVVRSGYGDLQSVRYVASGSAAHRTFVYPRNASAPTGAAVRDSFMVTSDGFTSVLGRVQGNTYVGATSAGGEASSLDIDGDGTADVSFGQVCKFVLQLDGGHVVAVEADRAVAFTMGARAPVMLRPYVPVRF